MLVLSITQIHGGHSLNALPDSVELRGTLRYFDGGVASTAHRRMHEMAEGVARTHAVKIGLNIQSQYPVTANDPDAAGIMLRASELSRDRVEDARTVLKVGDPVEARFTGVDRKSRAIVLSIRAIEAEEEAEAVQQYRGTDSATGTSLGDLLKEQISGQ